MRSDKQEQEQKFTRRALMMGGGGALVFTAVGANLYNLQILREDEFRVRSDDNQFNFELVPPSRGRILDRFGVPIAENRDSYRVLVTPDRLDDLDVTLDQLSEYMEISDRTRERVRRDAARSRTRPVVVEDDLDWETFARINLQAHDLGGVTPDIAEVRAYPFGETFYHVVGYVRTASDDDIYLEPENENLLEHPGFRIGQEGVEKAREQVLRGAPGDLKIEVNNIGRIIREVPEGSTPPVQGGDVVLTLDADIQRYAAERLQGESAVAIVMDVRSGELIALLSTPGADPNLYVTGLSAAQYREYSEDEYRPLYDKALMGQFSPGSTFKSVVAAAALEHGVMPPGEAVNCTGVIEYGDRNFHCWRRRGHGRVDLHEAIKTSCDVYFYEVADRLGRERIADMARRMGLGEIYDIGIPGEQSGLIPTPAYMRAERNRGWSGGDTLNFAIGQGDLLATPLQLTVMTARIAGGRQVRPTIYRDALAAPPAYLDLTDDTYARVREALRAVCHEPGGTSYGLGGLGIDGVEMAGKTGTAQVFSISEAEREAGVREQDELPWRLRDNGLFCCYAPANDPKYAVTVVVQHGGGSSAASAPARDILRRTIERDPSGRPAMFAAAPAPADRGEG